MTTVKLASGSPSLTFTSVDGGVRFVVHAFLTASDFVYWWNIPDSYLVKNYFYGKDFVAALNTIRNGASSAIVRFVDPGITPAEDAYDTREVIIFGSRLSAFYGRNQVVNLSQSGDVVTMTTPVTAPSDFSLAIGLSKSINCLQDAARGENNALCSFTSNVYNIGMFWKE